MADGSKLGLTAVLEQLGPGAAAGDVDQAELFADADDAPSSLSPAPASAGRGRPKGARNRSTEQWRQFLLGRYQSPLVGLAETWSRSALELAKELGLTRVVRHLAPGDQAIETLWGGEGGAELKGYVVYDRLAAFNVQQAARVAALPYLHQKQPLALDLPPNTRGLLILGNLDTEGAEDVHALPLAPEQNQQVIEHEPQQSHDTQSHAKPNPLRHNDD